MLGSTLASFAISLPIKIPKDKVRVFPDSLAKINNG
jgi:hypothetical protein